MAVRIGLWGQAHNKLRLLSDMDQVQTGSSTWGARLGKQGEQAVG